MGYFSFIPRTYRVALGLALLVFSIACAVMPIFGPVLTEDGEFVIVPTLLVGVFGFFGLWLLVDGTLLASPPEAELDFSDIPYEDGTLTQKPEEVPEVPLTIEEKLAARKERLEKAKREGKI